MTVFGDRHVGGGKGWSLRLGAGYDMPAMELTEVVSVMIVSNGGTMSPRNPYSLFDQRFD